MSPVVQEVEKEAELTIRMIDRYGVRDDVSKAAFERLHAFERGIVAQLLLAKLIKQGRFEEQADGDRLPDFVISFEKWQLGLLACFSEEAQTAREDRPKLQEELFRLS